MTFNKATTQESQKNLRVLVKKAFSCLAFSQLLEQDVEVTSSQGIGLLCFSVCCSILMPEMK